MTRPIPIGLLVACGLTLASCAASQGGLMTSAPIETMSSNKPAGVVAGCVQQALRGAPTMGTDGTRYWVTRQNSFGPVVRYDFLPASNGSTVEYRSRLKVNNGVDKVRGCL